MLRRLFLMKKTSFLCSTRVVVCACNEVRPRPTSFVTRSLSLGPASPQTRSNKLIAANVVAFGLLWALTGPLGPAVVLVTFVLYAAIAWLIE